MSVTEALRRKRVRARRRRARAFASPCRRCPGCDELLFRGWGARIADIYGLVWSDRDDEIRRDCAWRYPLEIAQRLGFVVEALERPIGRGLDDAQCDLDDLIWDEAESRRLNGPQGCRAALRALALVPIETGGARA